MLSGLTKTENFPYLVAFLAAAPTGLVVAKGPGFGAVEVKVLPAAAAKKTKTATQECEEEMTDFKPLP